MIVKIFGVLDILSALIFWLFSYFGLFSSLLLIIAFYLLIKGAVFLISRDVASILDIICAGIIFLAISFTLPKFLAVLVVIFLIQKGIISLF